MVKHGIKTVYVVGLDSDVPDYMLEAYRKSARKSEHGEKKTEEM